jgi:adenylate cyclase
LKIGVGLSTSLVLSGNIGTAKRMELSVVGEGVNRGSRIEGTTKHYGVEIMVCEDTVKAVGDGKMAFREIDLVTVKGTHNALRIYQLLAEYGADYDAALTKREKAMLPLFNDAVRLYRNREWQKALDGFEECLAMSGKAKDRPSEIVRGHGGGLLSHNSG